MLDGCCSPLRSFSSPLTSHHRLTCPPLLQAATSSQPCNQRASVQSELASRPAVAIRREQQARKQPATSHPASQPASQPAARSSGVLDSMAASMATIGGGGGGECPRRRRLRLRRAVGRAVYKYKLHGCDNSHKQMIQNWALKLRHTRDLRADSCHSDALIYVVYKPVARGCPRSARARGRACTLDSLQAHVSSVRCTACFEVLRTTSPHRRARSCAWSKTSAVPILARSPSQRAIANAALSRASL